MNQRQLFSWLLCTLVLMTVFIPMVGAQDAAQGIGNTLSEMDISLVNPFTGEGMQVSDVISGVVHVGGAGAVIRWVAVLPGGAGHCRDLSSGPASAHRWR